MQAKTILSVCCVYIDEGGEFMVEVLAEVPCKNNEQALIQLMTVYGTDIKRLCQCILNDPYLAEDAAQETFFKA